MSSTARTGTLRARDSFDLIRLLARSQTDPRKATAELVQNSLDAGARRLVVTRARERGAVVLKIADDGEGVLPDLAREDALEYLARNIGHSRKHGLTLEERRGALGRYGIGLIGFWAIGEELELRTRVRDGRVLALVLREDEPGYKIVESAFSSATTDGDPLRAPTCTEVVVQRVHSACLSALAGRRLQDYLAFELRGQIRERGVPILLHDGLARGRGARVFRVEPRALEGIPLDGPAQLEVPGFRAARLELRVLSEGARGGVALAAEGAIVADDLAREPALGLDHAPWTEPRLAGVVDFPDLAPGPGSRRGVVPNRAAEALRSALLSVEANVVTALAVAREAPARELEREALQRLRRAFSNLTLELPRYELLGVAAGAAPAPGPDVGNTGLAVGSPEGGEPEMSDEAGKEPEKPLGEPGDASELSTVEIVPSSVAVPPGGARNARAIARDGAGREIESGLTFAWSIEDSTLATLAQTDGARARLRAGEPEGATHLCVSVTSANGRSAEARAEVSVRVSASRSRSGIPDPVLIDDTTGSWRTRVREGRWEVNSGHRDYRLVRDRAERRLEYLAILLAKEIVFHSEGGDSRVGEVLESLAEVSAYALRQL
ncbi:ATP-binding protein [bacterium]|nr:ATP-binding protein [bacterium]